MEKELKSLISVRSLSYCYHWKTALQALLMIAWQLQVTGINMERHMLVLYKQ
jgi:hypothetical protein